METTKFNGNPSKGNNPNSGMISGPQSSGSTARETKQAKENKSSIDWQRTAIGSGAGLLIGGIAAYASGLNASKEEPRVIVERSSRSGKEGETGWASQNASEHSQAPGDAASHDWTDGNISVASAVNDGMTFSKAFETARQEVGPGGCFEWRGQVYSTYTKDEWNKMSAEERSDYESHFSWNRLDTSGSDIASGSHHHSETHASAPSAQEHTASSAQEHTAHTAVQASDDDDDIEVVSVNHTGTQSEGYDVTAGVETAETYVPEVEVLGVAHDDETGANAAALLVDGHEAVVIDVDGDMVIDYFAVDLNDNGTVDEGELVDVHEAGQSMAELCGMPDPMNDTMASNDYSDDIDMVMEG